MINPAELKKLNGVPERLDTYGILMGLTHTPLSPTIKKKKEGDVIRLPMHESFIKILDRFKKQYGDKLGTQYFYSWVNKNGYDDTKPMPSKRAYKARLYEPFAFEGKHYAKITVMDTNVSGPTSPSGEKWQVTYDGLKSSMPTFMKAPLIGPPEEGHNSNKIMGVPVKYTMPDGYIDVVYEITDDEAWKNIKEGKWNDVSPQVISSKVDIRDDRTLLNDFLAEHVAFVNTGAFTCAEVRDICDGGSECIHRLAAELLQGHRCDEASIPLSEGKQDANMIENIYQGASAWDTIDAPDKYFAYVPSGAPKSERKLPLASREKHGYDEAIVRNALARFSQTHLPDSAKGSVLSKICGVAKQLGIDSDLCKTKQGETKMSENKTDVDKLDPCTDKVAELTIKLTELQAEYAKERHKREFLERSEPHKTMQAQIDRITKENEVLKSWKQEREQGEQTKRAEEVIDYRIQVGLCDERDRKEEIEKFKNFEAGSLDAYRDDLVAMITEINSQGPKARFTGTKRQPEDMHAQVRAKLGLQ